MVPSRCVAPDGRAARRFSTAGSERSRDPRSAADDQLAGVELVTPDQLLGGFPHVLAGQGQGVVALPFEGSERAYELVVMNLLPQPELSRSSLRRSMHLEHLCHGFYRQNAEGIHKLIDVEVTGVVPDVRQAQLMKKIGNSTCVFPDPVCYGSLG